MYVANPYDFKQLNMLSIHFYCHICGKEKQWTIGEEDDCGQTVASMLDSASGDHQLRLIIVSQSCQADMTGLVELSPTSNACHTVLPC